MGGDRVLESSNLVEVDRDNMLKSWTDDIIYLNLKTTLLRNRKIPLLRLP